MPEYTPNVVGGVDQNDRPDLYQSIWNQVMAIPEFGRTTYDKWLASRFQDSVGSFFRQESDSLNGREAGAPSSQSYGDFLTAARKAGSGFGYGSSDAVNRYAGLTPADLDAAQQEFSADFSGSGVSFADLQRGAIQNSIQKNFGGRSSKYAMDQIFSNNALSKFALDPASQDGGFLSSRLNDLRGRYGLPTGPAV